MEELKNLINELKKVREETNLSIQDTVLFENAVDIYISSLISNSKNGLLATPKQLEFLKKLGVQARSGLTKKEASDLIEGAKK